MRDAVSRAYSAEANVNSIAKEAKRYIGMMGARCILLEAAMAVIVKHDLMDDFVNEHATISARNHHETEPKIATATESEDRM